MELSWKICPHCAASQVNQQTEWVPTQHAQPTPTTMPEERALYQTPESLEFIESDEY
jgi:hypothetical protein